MEDLKARAAFFTDLSQLQAELHALKKDVQGYGYRYADLAQTIETLKEICPKYGFSYTTIGEVVDGKQIAKTVIGHKSGYSLDSEILLNADEESRGKDKNGTPNVPAINDPQAIGSWWTYARRYMLQGAFGMATTDDDGARATSRSFQGQGRANNANGGQARGPSRAISEPQLKRLYAIAMGSGWNVAQVFAFCQDNFNKEPSELDWKTEYEKACDYFEKNKNKKKQPTTKEFAPPAPGSDADFTQQDVQ